MFRILWITLLGAAGLAGPSAAQTEAATCITAERSYPCLMTDMAAEAGFTGAVQLTDPAGRQPAWFVRFRINLSAEVFQAGADGQWRYLGTWRPIPEADGVSPSDCLEPAPSQSAQAVANLAGGTWRLCVR